MPRRIDDSVSFPVTRSAAVETPASKPVEGLRRRLVKKALKGDGMTGEKPRLPSMNDVPVQTAPAAGPAPMSLSQLLATQAKAGKATVASKVTAADSADPAAEIPAELVTLAATDGEGFKKAYLAALELEEPWALALQTLSKQKDSALRERITRDIELDGDPPKGRYLRQYQGALQAACSKGEPWALALKADQAAASATANAATVARLTNTAFDPAAPEVGSGTAADGSIQVPGTPESSLVLGYVRTNPIVQKLREEGMANIYNPLYAKHLAAAMSAAGPQGEPPRGKGFLALTDHGFALVYDPSRTLEENKKLAEFSCKTGLTIDQVHEARAGGDHGDKKFDDVLAEFNAFDPTKPGDVKIALDGKANGNWQVVLHSDGNGLVQMNHEHQRTTWSKIGDVAGEIGLAVAAVVVTIATEGGAAGYALSLAAAVKQTYTAIKNDDGLGMILGMLGGMGAIGSLAGSLGAAGEVAATGRTLTQVAGVIKGIDGVVHAIEKKDVFEAVKGVAGAVGSVAGLLGGSPDVSNVFNKIASVAKDVGLVAAFGQQGLAAIKDGDYLSALSAAIGVLETTGALKGIDPEVLKKIKTAVGALSGAEKAITSGDYAGAVEAVLNGVDKTVPGASDSLLLTGGVAIAGLVSAISQKDPMKAAGVLANFMEKVSAEVERLGKDKSPAAAAMVADLNEMMKKFGGAKDIFNGAGALVSAVHSGKAMDVVDQAAGLIATLTQNGQVGAARAIFNAGRQMVAAIKSGDYSAITLAGQALGEAISGAVDTFGKPRATEGTVGAAISGPKCPETPEEIKAALAAAGDEEPVNPETGEPDPDGVVDPGLSTATVTGHYQVRQGDSLAKIARKLLGDENLWPELYWANRDQLTDPNKLSIGVTLNLPDKNFRLTADVRNQLFAQAAAGMPRKQPKAPVGPPADPAVQALLGKVPEADQRLKQTIDFVTKLHDTHAIDGATYGDAMNSLEEAAQALKSAREYLRLGDTEHAITAMNVVDSDLAGVTDAVGGVQLLPPSVAKSAVAVSQNTLDNLAQLRKDVGDYAWHIPAGFDAYVSEIESDARRLRNLVDSGKASFSEVQTLVRSLNERTASLRESLNGTLDPTVKAGEKALWIMEKVRTLADVGVASLAPAGGPLGEVIGSLYVGITHGVDEYMKSGSFQDALYQGLRDSMIEAGGAVAGLGPLQWAKKLEAMSPLAKSYFSNVVTATTRAAMEATFETMAKIKEIKEDKQGNKQERINAEIAKGVGAVLAKGMLAAQSVAVVDGVPVKMQEKVKEAMTNLLSNLQKRLVDAGTKAGE